MKALVWLCHWGLFVCLWVGRGRAKGRLSLWLCQELLLMTPAFRGIDSSQAVLNGPGLGLSHARHLSIIDPVPPHQLCSWCIPSPCINVRLGLEITLQALMPTPVQLSTVGQPLVQWNHKLHVIEGRSGKGRLTDSAFEVQSLVYMHYIYRYT